MSTSRGIKHSNFIDLDVVAAGSIVPQLSASFDAFWNSKYAYPIASLASRPWSRNAAAPLDESALEGRGELAGAGTRCRNGLATDLGARHGARGSAGQNRERYAPDEEVTIANNLRC
jgi:phosphatidylserine/phosphatidylglycerophosphate/cardiolipin synthase-like enzyme